ncbi:uncharacterized protein An08g11650, partial [Aspergillus niger]|uniref:RING-type domain-containing protein n=2 Tax=Aspergillus niger TaxID=5061 RepID=A0AAJ8C180_ASPNG
MADANDTTVRYDSVTHLPLLVSMRISILAVGPREKKTVTQAEGDSESHGKVATAQENGWQRCFSCWRMVELDHGCNHMTFDAFCRCGAEFCYNCGMEGKNCQCEQWNEHGLLARAYQIIDREANQPAAATPRQDADEAILE